MERKWGVLYGPPSTSSSFHGNLADEAKGKTLNTFFGKLVCGLQEQAYIKRTSYLSYRVIIFPIAFDHPLFSLRTYNIFMICPCLIFTIFSSPSSRIYETPCMYIFFKINLINCNFILSVSYDILIDILPFNVLDESANFQEYSGNRNLARCLRCGTQQLLIITALASLSLFIYDGLQV